MKKKFWKDLQAGAQIGIILAMMLLGFGVVFVGTLSLLGVPVRWWGVAVSMPMAMLSTLGMVHWIRNS